MGVRLGGKLEYISAAVKPHTPAADSRLDDEKTGTADSRTTRNLSESYLEGFTLAIDFQECGGEEAPRDGTT